MRGKVRRLRWFSVAVIAAPLLLALCTASVTLAATRQVAPGGTDSGDCTGSPCQHIAYAVGQANSAGGDTVTVAAGTYSEHDIAVSKSVTIAGAGAASTTVSAGGAGRVFSLTDATKTVTISGLTITGGYPGPGRDGGGVLNKATLTLLNDTVSGNNVNTYYDSGTGTHTYAHGGGIYNDTGAALTLTGTTISGNIAGKPPAINNIDPANGGTGGGIASRGTLTITGGTISGNIAFTHMYSGFGGGIASTFGVTIQITNTTITANQADDRGTGIYVGDFYDGSANPNGGSLTLDHASVTNNIHRSDGFTPSRYYAVEVQGDIGSAVAMPLTMKNTTVTGNAGGVYWVAGVYCATITDSTISGNALLGGAAIAGASISTRATGCTNTIARTVISNNGLVQNNIAGSQTGGLLLDGSTTITDSQITGNKGLDGGLTLGGDADTTITLTGTTVSGNSSVLTSPSFSGNYAGGIDIDYSGGLNPTIRLINSTVSNNSSDYDIGGIMAYGSLTLAGTTISGNSGRSTSGVFFNPASGNATFAATNSTISGNTGSTAVRVGFGHATLTNTTVAANTTGVANDPNYGGQGTLKLTSSILKNAGANCALGAVTTGGYNVISDASCGFAGGTDLSNTDPQIDTLKDNGGPTKTHALLPGSPAIDRIPNAGGCNGAGLTADQRGQPRPQPAGGLCDAGAYEAGPSAPPAPTNLHVTGATYNSLTWGWSESDATAPLIYTVDGAHFYGLAAGTTSFTLYGIAYGSYACMSIAAYNGAGSSSYTPYSCSYVQPLAPYNPHQVAGATTNSAPIAWTNYDALSYEQVYDYATAAWHQVGQNGTSYTLTGIPAGTYHCAAVQAYNVNYASGYSYACPFATPNAPTNIHASSVSGTSVTFSWTAPDPYSWYYVYETSPAAGHVVTGTSFTTTHLITSGAHAYACIYVAAGGYGGTSSYPYACAWAY